MKFIKEVGLLPRLHGNSRKRNRALHDSDVRRVEVFLNKYGQEYGLPDPGRIRNDSDKIIFLLPSRMTKISVYLAYCESLMSYDSSLSLVSKSTFMKIWKELCNYDASQSCAGQRISASNQECRLAFPCSESASPSKLRPNRPFTAYIAQLSLYL